MEQDAFDRDDKCQNGKCWIGPMMLIQTEKGATGDLNVALRLFLAKVHGKAMADAMVAHMTYGHFHAERTIIAHAVGREPAGAVLREICALVEVHYNSVLKTHSATYHFKLQEADEEGAYPKILAHYRWLKGLDHPLTVAKNDR